MKTKFLFFFLSCFIIQVIDAQECKGFFAFEPDTKFEMTYYDKKGKVTSYSEQMINDVREMDGVIEAEVSAVIKDEKGEVISENDFRVECNGSGYKIDLANLMNREFMGGMEDMELSISGVALEMPGKLTVGQRLPDADAEIEVRNNDFKMMTMSYTITNRKVEAKESVTTAAGTFDCYKISYDFEMKTILKKKMKVTQWVSEGVGVVKAEYYNKKGKLESAEELTKFQKA